MNPQKHPEELEEENKSLSEKKRITRIQHIQYHKENFLEFN